MDNVFVSTVNFIKINLKPILWAVGALSCFASYQSLASALTIKLAATDWCPYTCSNQKSSRGIAHDYVEYIFQQRNVALQVSSYPWARAIRQVEKGELHGLLTAVPSESEKLIYTKTPMMSYQMCFFGDKNANWQYVDRQSLQQVRIGAIAEYGYGEPVDSFLKDENNQSKVVELSSSQSLQQLISLVAAARIDVLIEDKNVMKWHLKNTHHTLVNEIKNLGCLEESPFYLAMSPKINWSTEVIDFLNRAFETKDNQQWLYENIMMRY